MSDAELVELSDEVAFENISLICDGPVLTLYQHIMDGSLNWHNPAVSTEITDAPGSHTAPKNWSELKTALLDCLMPFDSVEDSALRLAEFKINPGETVASYALRFQSKCTRFEADSALRLAEFKINPGETVASYALRFQLECTRFEACVQRVTPGRSPYAALSIVLFRNGVVPGIRLLASQEQHSKTMCEAVAQLRRLEAANLTGSNTSRINAHVSATSFTTFPNRTAIAQQYDAISLRAASGKAGCSSGGSGSGGAGSSGPKGKSFKGKSPMGDKFPKGARTDKERPKCAHPTCKSKVGHWLEECWTRQREERDARRARATSKRNKGGGNGGGKRSKKAPAPDDDDDDN